MGCNTSRDVVEVRKGIVTDEKDNLFTVTLFDGGTEYFGKKSIHADNIGMYSIVTVCGVSREINEYVMTDKEKRLYIERGHEKIKYILRSIFHTEDTYIPEVLDSDSDYESDYDSDTGASASTKK